MTLKNLSVLGLALGLAACLNSSEPFGGQQNYGFVVLETGLETEDFVLQPSATFYRTGQIQLPGTTSTADDCIILPFNPDQGGGIFPPTLSAGASLQLTLSGVETQLDSVRTLAGLRYIPADLTAFTPGDTVTIDVPGADGGFPSWTMRAKTAEAFTADEVPTHEDPASLEFRWTPATGAGSRMVVSLRYPDVGGEMLELYCELADDGAYDLTSDLAEGWRIANALEKEASFTRWRITTQTTNGAVLLAMSSLQVPTPTFGVQ